MNKQSSVSATFLVMMLIHLPMASLSLQAEELPGQYDVLAGNVTRHTLVDKRFEKVIRQQRDYSCGAATLATLMTYYFNDEKTEQEILHTLVTGLSEEGINDKENTGFSLLDLKRAAEAHGYRAAGYRLTIDQLKKLTGPVIVHVTPKGYQHFALARMVVEDRVFLADPSRGNFRVSLKQFQEEWDGVVFIIEKGTEDTERDEDFGRLTRRDMLIDKTRWFRQIERTTLF